MRAGGFGFELGKEEKVRKREERKKKVRAREERSTLISTLNPFSFSFSSRATLSINENFLPAAP